jgi:hypothetical protein
MLFYSLVFSKLLYGLEIFGNTSKKNLSPLVITINQVLRACQCKSYDTPIKELYCTYQVLPMQLLFKFKMLLCAYNAASPNSSIPPSLRNMLLLNANLHSYNTRSFNNFHVAKNFTCIPPCLPSNFITNSWNNYFMSNY